MRVAVQVFAGCGALAAAILGDSCLPMEPEGELGNPNLATVQSVIFTAKCALPDCHAGATPRQGMSLEPGKTSGLTINVQAVEAPMLRIKPGDPNHSYLIAKVEGRQHDVGGSGEQMPLGFTPLSSAEIKLLRDWITSLGRALALPPSITKVTPPSGAIGDQILIEGDSFGDAVEDSTVVFGSTPATFLGSWSAKSFQTIVPQGMAPGPADIVVTVGGKKSPPFPFTVRTDKVASVVTVAPDMGPVGTVVEIRGSNFGDSQGTGTVTFGGVDAGKATMWMPTMIDIAVPVGAKSGDLVVTVNGAASNATPFFFLEPKLSSLQDGVFTRRCALSACHGSATPPPNNCGGKPGQSLLMGNTYSNIVGVTSCENAPMQRVKAGDKANSYLFLKLSLATPPNGSQMPADGTAPLPADTIRVIGDWIDQGAQNN